MTPTQRLRALVRDKMTPTCPTCGEVRRLGLRPAAAEMGIGHTVLMRFLCGQVITSDTFDLLSAWVETPRQGGE